MADICKQRDMLFRVLVVFSAIVLCLGHTTEDYDDLINKPDQNVCEDIEGCYCVDKVVYCDGATFTDIRVIYPYISENTTRVSITNGRINELPENLFGDDASKTGRISYLNVSGNPLTRIHAGSLMWLTGLEKLDLSDTIKSTTTGMDVDELAAMLSFRRDLKELYLRNTVLHVDDPGYIFSLVNMTDLYHLDLSGNSFVSTGPMFDTFACTAYKITHLNMSNNAFHSFPVPTCMVNLQVLDLSNNKLQFLNAIDMDVLESFVSLTEVRLAGNPWSCSCYMDKMLPWLKATPQPLDFDDMRCVDTYNDDLIGQPIRDFNITEMCEEPRIIVCPGGVEIHMTKGFYIGVFAAGFVTTVLAVVLIIAIRRRRRRRTPSTPVPENMPKSPAYHRMV